MSALLQSSLAAALEVVLIGCGIQTLDDLAERIRSDGDRIADYITSSECRRAGYAAVQAAIQRQRKPVMMDAGLQVQAVVAEASHPQQMRSVGSLVRPRWLPGCVTQAAVQTPRSLATGVNVASQTRTTAPLQSNRSLLASNAFTLPQAACAVEPTVASAWTRQLRSSTRFRRS